MIRTNSILIINRSDLKGGAAVVSWNLFSMYKTMGLKTWFFVQHKLSDDPNVIQIQNDHYRSSWFKFVNYFKNLVNTRRQYLLGTSYLNLVLDLISNPLKMIRYQLGIEENQFPGAQAILTRLPHPPDIIHAHVLHGDYFDIRVLKIWSTNYPIFITLHDSWMLAGHCAHSFNCERWKTGCGKCPDLTIPKAIKRDSSAYNWKVKNDVYSKSKLYVATPSQWLMNKVNQSMLAKACIETRVIPNGVDHEVFFPSSRIDARKVLGLDQHAFIFLFSANGIRRNRWKDFELMKKALEIVSEQKQQKRIVFLALGENAAPVFMENAEIQFVPFRSDPKSVADFYRASDVYLHASKADTFPNAVLEALSCGTPVIGTNVGGIPEQVKGLVDAGFLTSTSNRFSDEEATGILVKAGDSDSFAKAMMIFINSDELRERLGKNASKDAFERFPLSKQTNAYIDWYQQVLKKRNE